MTTEHVSPQHHGSTNSLKVGEIYADRVEALAGDGFCYWNDKKYSDGATVCDNHRRYECWNGKWAEIGDC